MLHYLMLSFMSVFVILGLKILNWVWFQPKRMERILRKQGLSGNPYRLLLGDTKEISAMYSHAHSTTLALDDDIVPRIMPFIKKTVETYGEISFSWVGPRPRIIMKDLELMKIAVMEHVNYPKSFNQSNKMIRLVLGGLGSYQGEKWRKSRIKFNPVFYVDRLKEKIHQFERCAEKIINQLESKISKDGSGIVDIVYYMEEYTGSVMTQMLLTREFDAEMRRNCDYLKKILIMTDTASKPFNIPGFWYLPTKKKKKALAMEKQFRDSFMSLINERLDGRNAGEQGVGSPDLLDLFLDDLYNGNVSKSRTRKAIIDEAIAECKLFYFAGFDTTSTLLVWSLVTLASHKNWQARAREEVLHVLGKSKDLTIDKLNQLKIVTMIMQEVLRLYPPVMELSRLVEEDRELGGYHIPKGVILQFPVAMLHRSTEIWGEDALEFKPDRFSQGLLKAANGQAAFMAFGFGPRICIGQNLALMEAKILLAQFLRTFSFELSPTYKHTPYPAFALQPQYGAPLVLSQI